MEKINPMKTQIHSRKGEIIMNRYMVTWYRKEFPGTEFTDIIDGVNSEQEAVDKVRDVHLNAIVIAVGIMVTNWL